MRSEVYFMKEKINKQLKRGKKYLKRVKDEKLIKYLMDSGFSYKLILSVADEE